MSYFPCRLMCVISFFVFLSWMCTVCLRSRVWQVHLQCCVWSSLVHFPSCVWDFYIFCVLFGDLVINWYLRDINVLQPLYFDRIVYLFIIVFSYFILCHWCPCA